MLDNTIMRPFVSIDICQYVASQIALYVAIPEMLVLKGYIDHYGSLLPQSQYVA